MVKKDYEKFAEMFRVEVNRMRNYEKHYEHEADPSWWKALNHWVTEVADVFQSDNSRFDRDRFFKAIYGFPYPVSA